MQETATATLTFKDVFRSLREQIVSGEISGRLPSLFELQKRYSVSTNTLKKALALLKEQRFVKGHQGKGIFVNADHEVNVLAQKNVALFLSPLNMTSPFYLGIVYEMRLRLEAERCNVIILNTLSQLEAFAAQFDLLVLFRQFDSGVPRELASIDPTKIICCNCRQLEQTHWVGSDNVLGGYLAAQFLYDSGCRRLGMLRCDDISDEASYIVMRRQGMERFAAEHRDVSFFHTGYRCEDRRRPRSLTPVEALFAQQPDGVFISLDLLAFRVYDYCRLHGIAIGKDVQLIGFDNSVFCEELDPPLSSIREDVKDIGQSVIGMIRDLLCGTAAADRVAVPPVIVDRRRGHETVFGFQYKEL